MGILGRPIMVAASLLLAACAGQASVEKSHPVPLGERANPPHGYTDFCSRNPEDCGSAATPLKKPFALSKARWFELDTVNSMVNHMIVAATDVKQYGLNEYWTYPVESGDCEDYALLKRKDLFERGWPLQSLLLTVGYDRDSRAHAVLMVSTDKGDYVLDNLTDEILPWWEAPYDWTIRQSEENPQQWVQMRPAEKSVDVASTKPRSRKASRSPIVKTED